MRSDPNTIAADLGCTVNSANIKVNSYLILIVHKFIVCYGSDSQLRGSNPVPPWQTLGFFHSILLQFTQLYEYVALDSGG